jgi:hypothetical protein
MWVYVEYVGVCGCMWVYEGVRCFRSTATAASDMTYPFFHLG